MQSLIWSICATCAFGLLTVHALTYTNPTMANTRPHTHTHMHTHTRAQQLTHTHSHTQTRTNAWPHTLARACTWTWGCARASGYSSKRLVSCFVMMNLSSKMAPSARRCLTVLYVCMYVFVCAYVRMRV